MSNTHVLYFVTEAVAYHNSYFGDGDGPISYSRVSCGGWEKKLTDCSSKKYPSFSCSREHVAGVLCGDGKLTTAC